MVIAAPPAKAATIPRACHGATAKRLCAIHHYRHTANHYRRMLGRRALPYSWIAERYPARRDRILAYWHHAARHARHRYEATYVAARRWAATSAARCVSGLEGGLTSVNPAGPYFGKWQADRGFEQAYNRAAYDRMGDANHWPERDQDLMAYRGHEQRGWAPWPNTSAQCGLR